MKTTSVYLFSPSVPCENRCRYCLLQWDGRLLGADCARSLAYARRFYRWLRENRPELQFVYYFGYSMEHPDLPAVLPFLQQTGSPSGRFLQMDGMKMRSDAQLHDLFRTLKALGIEETNFTYYGAQDYHDRFAARAGDFALMERSRRIAAQEGLRVSVGIPTSKENLSQLEALVAQFDADGIPVSLFTPHCGGRGYLLLDAKITVADYEAMPATLQERLSRRAHRTAWEWCQDPPKEPENRILQLALLESEMERLEALPFAQILRKLEQTDEAYYALVPGFSTLLPRYAEQSDPRLYTKKDLYALYRRRYIAENRLTVTEVNDERLSGSIRY